MSELAQVQGNTVEQELVAVRDITVNTARSMVIKDAPSYEAASKFLIEIKRRARQVADYWKPAKDMAKAAHQEICDREKAMLNPLSDAEMAIKGNMGTYLAAEQKKRLAAEAEARRQQQEERDRLLAEAVKSEKTGDAVGVEMNMAMAGMVEDMRAPVVVAAPKADGISTRMVWKARVIAPESVPVMSNGFLIRPVDTAMLNQIAKLTKGTADIPGVEFYEDSVISARV